ncbi:MAG: hypothetical protein ACK48A_04205 [Pseudanabaena sp.]
MKLLNLVAPLFVISAVFAIPALAGEKDPLFVNMTADQQHRSTMAIQFSKSQFERNHHGNSVTTKSGANHTSDNDIL